MVVVDRSFCRSPLQSKYSLLIYVCIRVDNSEEDFNNEKRTAGMHYIMSTSFSLFLPTQRKEQRSIVCLHIRPPH